MIVGNIASTQGYSKELNFGGTIGVQPVAASFNPLKRSKKIDITSNHPGDKCIKCLNFILIDPRTNYQPDEIIIDISTIIIIPYNLKLHIKNLEVAYGERFEDLRNWLEKQKTKFSEMLKCYVKDGSRNPCREKAVGYKLSLIFIKSEITMDLRIIVDDSNVINESQLPKYEYRMVFKGGEVECPN